MDEKTLDIVGKILSDLFDCVCNFNNFDELLVDNLPEEWFSRHCKPECDDTSACWKEFLKLKAKYYLTPDKSAYYPRIDKDRYYLEIAKVVAKRSTCLHRQYGAVIVNNDIIISTGYNGSPRGETNCCDAGFCYRDRHRLPKDPAAAGHGDQYGSCVAVHAEQNAIINASWADMQGATLYLASLDDSIIPAPCNSCDRMIRNAGITRVVVRAFE